MTGFTSAAEKQLEQNRIRRLVSFLHRAEPWADAAGLAMILLFVLQFCPLTILDSHPASGGDMGSHFWPLKVLLKYGLSHGSIRTWNPGNLAGEPHLLHYFPTPFLLMAGLSAVMPLATAFNVGTILPVFALPFCAYVFARAWKFRFPTPLLIATSLMPFLFNEGNSMWGGNALSVLAGQFAHEYALCFLLLATGAMKREFDRRRFPIISSLLCALVATSHGYVLYALPLVSVGFVLFCSNGSSFHRVKFVLLLGGATALLSFWHLLPLLANAPWTSPFSLAWKSPNLLREALPNTLYPMLGMLFFLLSALLFLDPTRRARLMRDVYFWSVPIVGYVILFFLFPKMGLVDIRALPQIQLFCCLLVGILLGEMLRSCGRQVAFCVALPVVVPMLWWVDLNVKKFPTWAEWNYSGWETKKLYPELQALTKKIEGDFSMPRVIYEHNKVNEAAGSLRVFEMLPYFSGRATLESVYMQANIVSPEIFYLQALISETPSCPYAEYPCPTVDLSKARDKLDLFGVQQLILATDKVQEAAVGANYLSFEGAFGPWKLFQVREQTSLVGMFNRQPLLLKNESGMPQRKEFFDWFTKYQQGDRFLVASVNGNSALEKMVQDAQAWTPDVTCKANVEVDFNTLRLQTTCPGKAHFLKFSFHPSWRADSGDELFLVSPGFIGLVPSAKTVTLKFGESSLWHDITLK